MGLRRIGQGLGGVESENGHWNAKVETVNGRELAGLILVPHSARCLLDGGGSETKKKVS